MSENRRLFDNIPQPKKIERTPKSLGLISKEKTKKRGYRFRVETIERLGELTEKINNKSRIKISTTQILELLIIDAHKNPSRILKLMNG